MVYVHNLGRTNIGSSTVQKPHTTQLGTQDGLVFWLKHTWTLSLVLLVQKPIGNLRISRLVISVHKDLEKSIICCHHMWSILLALSRVTQFCDNGIQGSEG